MILYNVMLNYSISDLTVSLAYYYLQEFFIYNILLSIAQTNQNMTNFALKDKKSGVFLKNQEFIFWKIRNYKQKIPVNNM